MPEPPIIYHDCPNGLRVVAMQRHGAPAGTMGVHVRVGARDEAPHLHGLAHFVEHTIFKGTSRRRAWHILNRMEAVGGELNAYTTKEETVVYTAFPGGNPARAADLVADLVGDSQFPAAQIEKEREVVADEIDSYLDTPADAVFDDFEDALFAGSSIGHNILGTAESLRTFDTATCRRWLRDYYTPDNMVAFYAGPWSPERAIAVIERAFAPLTGRRVPLVPTSVPLNAPFDIVRDIASHQCHTVVGARTCGLADPAHYTLGLLTNILGGPGMNSLLNVELRERRGLVYTVEASTGLFSDCGSVAIYYGCDPEDDARCRRLVAGVIARVADGSITARALERYKKQYLGQMIVGSVSLENRILGIARQTQFRGRALTETEVRAAIRSVTPAALASCAAALLPASTLSLR